MSALPHSASPTVSHGMLQTIADAICDRPKDTAAQRSVRFSAVMATVQGFMPRDAVETMLAGLAVTHAHLVEDSARDVFRGQDDRLKARTQSMIVALGRGMFGFLKELRTIQAQRLGTAVAKPDAAPVPVGSLDRAPVKAAGPKTRIAAVEPLADIGTPSPLSAPRRRAETSVAAMMAALYPPMPPYLVSSAAHKPASSGPETSAGSVQSQAA